MRMDDTPNLRYLTGQKCTDITADGIKAVTKTGQESFFKTDSIIVAAGMISNTNTLEELRDSVRNCFPVGDCVKPQKIMEAMQGGYYAALDIL